MSASYSDPWGFVDLIQRPVQERHQTEIEICGCALADPGAAVPIAIEEGIEPGDFCDDGLIWIFSAAILSHRLGRLIGPRDEDAMRVAMLSRDGLKRAGFWREHYACIHPPYFSAESLAALMNSWPSAAMTRHYCQKLNEINQRIALSRQHLMAARRLLEGVSVDNTPYGDAENGFCPLSTHLSAHNWRAA